MSHYSRSFANRKAIESVKKCGCYYCCKIYQTKLIKKWAHDKTGDTAICPKCGIDSVIAFEEKIDNNLKEFENYLQECNKKSF